MPAPTYSITLSYRPPLDWRRLCAFFRRRAIPGVESVIGDCYRRTIRAYHDQQTLRGWLAVAPKGRACLQLTVSDTLVPAVDDIVVRVRRQFDLDAPTADVAATLSHLAAPYPGLRVPGTCDGFETVVRGILGQQITVAAASTLAGRVARQLGTPITTPFAELTHTFPTATALAEVDADTLGQLGIVRTRVAAMRALAQCCAQGEIQLTPAADIATTLRALKALRGIGEWTAQYAAMRALKWADAFPAADHGLLKALGITSVLSRVFCRIQNACVRQAQGARLRHSGAYGKGAQRRDWRAQAFPSRYAMWGEAAPARGLRCAVWQGGGPCRRAAPCHRRAQPR